MDEGKKNEVVNQPHFLYLLLTNEIIMCYFSH